MFCFMGCLSVRSTVLSNGDRVISPEYTVEAFWYYYQIYSSGEVLKFSDKPVRSQIEKQNCQTMLKKEENRKKVCLVLFNFCPLFLTVQNAQSRDCIAHFIGIFCFGDIFCFNAQQRNNTYCKLIIDIHVSTVYQFTGKWATCLLMVQYGNWGGGSPVN